MWKAHAASWPVALMRMPSTPSHAQLAVCRAGASCRQMLLGDAVEGDAAW